jgi:exoribonuclease R
MQTTTNTTNPEITISAKHLTFTERERHEVERFINDYHPQKMPTGGDHYVAITHGFNLVGVFILQRTPNGHDVELTRFCTDGKARYSAIMRYIIDYVNRETIYRKMFTFADVRYDTRKFYRNSGWFQVGYIPALPAHATFDCARKAHSSGSLKYEVDYTKRKPAFR